jgi:hypothetical protein
MTVNIIIDGEKKINICLFDLNKIRGILNVITYFKNAKGQVWADNKPAKVWEKDIFESFAAILDKIEMLRQRTVKNRKANGQEDEVITLELTRNEERSIRYAIKHLTDNKPYHPEDNMWGDSWESSLSDEEYKSLRKTLDKLDDAII